MYSVLYMYARVNIHNVHVCFFQDYFESIEQFDSTRDELLSQLEAAAESLLAFPSEDHQLLRDTVHQLKEAYQFLTEKVHLCTLCCLSIADT